jgi:hypothetical protein
VSLFILILVRDEREFKINLRKISYDKFLPMKNSLDYKMPVIKAYSYRSTLFHETMIENIFRTTMNKLAYSYTPESEKETLKLKVSHEEDEDIKKKLEMRKNCKL